MISSVLDRPPLLVLLSRRSHFEVTSLRFENRCVTSADFVVPNSDEVALRSLREVIRSNQLYLYYLMVMNMAPPVYMFLRHFIAL
jgi:hypothetical protein